jgi:hypothetical protein
MRKVFYIIFTQMVFMSSQEIFGEFNESVSAHTRRDQLHIVFRRIKNKDCLIV